MGAKRVRGGGGAVLPSHRGCGRGVACRFQRRRPLGGRQGEAIWDMLLQRRSRRRRRGCVVRAQAAARGDSGRTQSALPLPAAPAAAKAAGTATPPSPAGEERLQRVPPPTAAPATATEAATATATATAAEAAGSAAAAAAAAGVPASLSCCCCCGDRRCIRCMATAAVHRRQHRPRQSRPQPLPAAELWDFRQRRPRCRSARGDLRAAGGQLKWTIAELPPGAKRSAGGSFESVRRQCSVCPAPLQWESN